MVMNRHGTMEEIQEEEDNHSLIQTLKSSSNPNSNAVVNKSPSFFHDKDLISGARQPELQKVQEGFKSDHGGSHKQDGTQNQNPSEGHPAQLYESGYQSGSVQRSSPLQTSQQNFYDVTDRIKGTAQKPARQQIVDEFADTNRGARPVVNYFVPSVDA